MTVLTLSELRSDLRVMLNDGGNNPIWPDTALDLCLNDALTEWTETLPYPASTAISVVSGQNEYDLPDDAVSVIRVRATINGKLQWLPKIGGEAMNGYWSASQEPVGYIPHFPIEEQVFFPRELEGASFTLYYGAIRVRMSDDTDSCDFGTRHWGPIAVRHLAGFYAFNPASTFRAQLEQWASKLDLKVDNPLEQEANRWLKEYQRLMLKHAQPATVEWE